ncbi:MAG TPA: hypothetical protein PK820_14660 [Candidatus Competibacteraceae bacterium]|nr:hypothetical protein [Gammaproteobacteria bacterium]HPF60013.1 hypothetical protein [Candidatus Competibacteraceae bacterium]
MRGQHLGHWGVPDCFLKRMVPLLMVSPHYLFFCITLTLRILLTERDSTQC